MQEEEWNNQWSRWSEETKQRTDELHDMQSEAVQCPRWTNCLTD